jgi:hypothetical protein
MCGNRSQGCHHVLPEIGGSVEASAAVCHLQRKKKHCKILPENNIIAEHCGGEGF